LVDLNYALDILDNDPVMENMLQGDIVLIEATEVLLSKLTPALLRELTTKKTAIVLLADKGYFDILPSFNAAGVDTSNLFFIDCVSKIHNQVLPDTGHVVDLKSVSEIKNVFISLLDKTDTFVDSSFVCFDSLSKLITLAPGEDFTKFLHILLTKLRTKGVGCLILSTRNEIVDELKADMFQLFDTVLHF